MASLADRLINRLTGSVLNKSATNVASSAPIRNSRSKDFSSTDEFAKSNENQYSYGSLRYPLNLGTNEEFGHYMLFHIFERTNSKYHGPQEVEEIIAAGTPFQRKETKTIDRASLEFSEGVVRQEDDDTIANIYKRQDDSLSKSISGGLRKSGRLVRTKDTIALYMPNGLKAEYGVSYKNSELGMAGVLAPDLAGVSNIDQLVSSLKAAGTGAAVRDTIADALAVGATTKVAGFLSGADVEGAVRKTLGKAINPALEAIFTGVDLRNFNFNFRFTPRNEKEFRTVDAIIKLFKFHMHPERVPGQNIGRHLIFPSEFDLQFMFGGVENAWIPFASSCVLSKLDVNYGPGGETQFLQPIAVPGGNAPPPSEINMSLSFTETEIMTKEKIAEGF
tara:strand:- start:79 stop:1251 length:1173 start_codon:yes stop_codon:yes gene_type:complete